MALFWRKTNITTNPNEVADVTLYGYYKDLSEGQKTFLYTQGGPDGLHALFQFPVSPTPLSGQGKIKRFDLKFYVSNIDASNRSSGALAYDIYSLNDDVKLVEGNINRELSNVLVFGSNASSSLTFSSFTNNFNDVNPDASAVYDDVAFDMVKGKPYLSVKDAQDLAIENQDIITQIGWESSARKKVKDLYATVLPGTGLVVPIMKGDDGIAWPANDAGGRNKYFWRIDNIAFGKFSEIKKKIKWAEAIQTGSSRPEAESKKLISYNNSNFIVLSTAQDVNLDGKPHMLSDIKVSTTDGVDGPAIEMINHWAAAGDEGGSFASSAQPAFNTGIRSGRPASEYQKGLMHSQDSFACMKLPMPVRLESNFKKIAESNTKGYGVDGKLTYSPAAPMELVFDMKIPEIGVEYITRDRAYGDADTTNRTRLTTHRAFILTFSNLLPQEGESFGYHISRMVAASGSGKRGTNDEALTLNNSFSALIFVADSDADEQSVRVYSPAQICNRSGSLIEIDSIGSGGLINLSEAHTLTIGDTVQFYQNTDSPNLPVGLTESAIYHVVDHDLSPSIKVSATSGGTAIVVSGGTGTTFVYRAPGEDNRLDLYLSNTNGFADGSTTSALGYTGVIEGTPEGHIPIGTWLKVRMTFDVSGGIADNYLTYTNTGRADYTINTSDGTQLVSGTLPKCEFPSDNNVWPGIEDLAYANYHTALQFDTELDADDGATADKTVLENSWHTIVDGQNYGWTPYFTIWNTNRKVETILGGSNLAIDEAQPQRTSTNVDATKVNDSVNKILIDNITIYNAEHQKSNMSPTFKSSKQKAGKIISNEATITGYRTQISGGEASQLASCYINVGYKNKSDFTNSSGFWLWNNYGTSDIDNTTTITDAAMGAGYSTRNEYLGDQFGIMSTHGDDVDNRLGGDTSGYTSQGGTTNRETGVFINNGAGYAAGVTALVVDNGSGGSSDSLTKFKRGDLVGAADGTIIGKIPEAGGTFNATNIPMLATQTAVKDNDGLYNIRYNQNYYQRINIGANPSSVGTNTIDVTQCWTTKDDTTLQTTGSSTFATLVVGQTITGFNVPTGTKIARIDSTTSLEMSNNATNSMTSSPGSVSAANTFTFDYSPLRLPRIYTENNVGDSLSHSVNGFIQKGFTKIVDGGSSSLWGFSKTDSSPEFAPGLWTKREHMGASTRILAIRDTNKFRVADSTVCDIADNEDYIIYLAYESFHSIDLLTSKRDINWLAPVRIVKDGDWYKIVNATLSGGEIITNLAQFTTSFSDVSAVNFITTSNIGRLFICPYRYWISICVNSAAYDYYVDRADAFTQKTGTYESANKVPTPNRHYTSITPVDSSTDVGSTFNESLFYYNTTTNKAPYFNQWTMDISMEDKTSAVDLAEDFGYGAFDAEEGSGGMVKNSNFSSGFNICKLDKLQENKGYEAGDLVSLYMTTADGNVDHNITINSSQHADSYRRPELLTVYEDEVPGTPSLNISSIEETPNSMQFTWDNQGGDLWYGLIFIDTMNINNQYHRSIGHLPLNENIEGTPTAYNEIYMKYYNVETTNTPPTAGRWLNDITGIAGYTKDFTSVNGYRDGGTSNNILYDTDGEFFSKDVHVGDNVYNITKINAGETADISTTVSSVDSSSQLTLASSSIFDSFQEYEVAPRFLKFGDTALLNTPLKLTGTAYITAGATTLNGHLTLFSTEVSQGQQIRIVDTIVTVASITSDTALEITPPYPGDTITANGVTIIKGNSNNKFQSEFSIVAHVVPNKSVSSQTGSVQYIFKKENSIEIKRLTTGILRAEVKYGSNTSDFTRVDSTTRLPTDGETPTCVILTIDTTLKYGNVKLYINGKLEDQSGKRLALPEQGKAWKGSPDGYGIYWDNAYSYFIGAGDIYGRYSFEGKIEEVVFYEKVLYPIAPQDEEFIFDKPVSEVEAAGNSAGNFKVYSGKLFIKDYHNIRGTTIDEVASSNSISFKKSSFLIEG